ncbi:MAG: glycerol-3-phosphate 1-O-acyltransferase PlsB [Granulosicoccus sp.]
MPLRFSALLERPLASILSLWVKPDVLPTEPHKHIDPTLPVLYVLEVGGLADRTALGLICRQHGLPSPSATLRFGSASESASVVVLRQRRGLIFRRHHNVISPRLGRLVDAGLASDAGELQVVPIAIYWGRAPEKESSFWRLLYTENWQIAGRSRKLLTTLLHGRNTLLRISEPLSFTTLKASGHSANEQPLPSSQLQRKLSRILRAHFRQRRIASLGPDQSHRRMLIDHVLSDPAVRKAVSDAVENDGKSPQHFQHKAERYAMEIAADVSYPTVRILHRMLTRLWNELYEGVQLDGIERLQAVADGHEVVYVPCHRSHIDYLLLSYILYVQGFSLPHIAAGINLNLPVVGGLLRRGGAFFLRRTFSGDPLYATVFNTYLKEILQRGHALEYFIEGGRSRTGRLLPPKSGILAMTVHAYLREPQTPVVFVPIYFGYERLLEGGAFTSELAGGKKQKESIFGLVRSLRTLREDYGRVHVNVGVPIELNQILDQHHSSWRQETVAEEKPDWLKPVIEELGNNIMRNINEAASVTPISLLAMALLATPRGISSQEDLQRQIRIYHRLLCETYTDTTVVVPAIDPADVIARGIRLKFIETTTDEIGPLIQLRPGQAAPLTYFRNNILHLITLPALIAAAFTNSAVRSDDALRKLVNLTFPFLQGELFLNAEFSESALQRTLHALEQAKLIRRDDAGWRRPAAGSAEAVSLIRMAEVVMPALERDYLCASLLARAPEEQVTMDDLAERCRLTASRLAQTYGRDAGDLYDRHLFKSFVKILEKQGYLTRNGDKLVATAAMADVEAEARVLLGENVRHAILSVIQDCSNAEVTAG